MADTANAQDEAADEERRRAQHEIDALSSAAYVVAEATSPSGAAHRVRRDHEGRDHLGRGLPADDLQARHRPTACAASAVRRRARSRPSWRPRPSTGVSTTPQAPRRGLPGAGQPAHRRLPPADLAVPGARALRAGSSTCCSPRSGEKGKRAAVRGYRAPADRLVPGWDRPRARRGPCRARRHHRAPDRGTGLAADPRRPRASPGPGPGRRAGLRGGRLRPRRAACPAEAGTSG